MSSRSVPPPPVEPDPDTTDAVKALLQADPDKSFSTGEIHFFLNRIDEQENVTRASYYDLKGEPYSPEIEAVLENEEFTTESRTVPHHTEMFSPSPSTKEPLYIKADESPENTEIERKVRALYSGVINYEH